MPFTYVSMNELSPDQCKIGQRICRFDGRLTSQADHSQADTESNATAVAGIFQDH